MWKIGFKKNFVRFVNPVYIRKNVYFSKQFHCGKLGNPIWNMDVKKMEVVFGGLQQNLDAAVVK